MATASNFNSEYSNVIYVDNHINHIKVKIILFHYANGCLIVLTLKKQLINLRLGQCCFRRAMILQGFETKLLNFEVFG